MREDSKIGGGSPSRYLRVLTIVLFEVTLKYTRSACLCGSSIYGSLIKTTETFYFTSALFAVLLLL